MAGDCPRDPILREASKQAAALPPRPFIHLRVHSAYSLLEGALQLAKIVAHAVKDAAPAIAVTDTNNLFGALEFAQKAVKEGVQPIIGCQLDFAFRATPRGGLAAGARRHGPRALSAGADRGQPRPATAIWSSWSAAPIWRRRPTRPSICRWRCSTASPKASSA